MAYSNGLSRAPQWSAFERTFTNNNNRTTVITVLDIKMVSHKL